MLKAAPTTHWCNTEETHFSSPSFTDNTLLLRKKSSTFSCLPSCYLEDCWLTKQSSSVWLPKQSYVLSLTSRISVTNIWLHFLAQMQLSSNDWNKNYASLLEAEHDTQLINNWHLSSGGDCSSSIWRGCNLACCAASPSTVNNIVTEIRS